MSVYLGTQLLSGIATNTILNAHDLFDFKWVDHQLTDQSWLNADTFSWQDGTVYTDAYNHLNADYNGGTSTTETIGSYTITYVLADDGHKITTDETTVANIYAESGVAWYYVIDQANTRFKLPRKRSTQVIENVVNSDGSWYRLYADGWVEQGAFVNSASGEVTVNFPITMKDTKYTTFKTPYTNSTNQVQWAYISFYDRTTSSAKTLTGGVGFSWEVKGISAINVDDLQGDEKYLYAYVGQFSQSATEQTAGLNSSLFNNKADLDLGNLDTTGKKVIDGQWVLPSSSSVADEVSANGSTDLAFDVSSFLPNDGYDYDVLVSCIATTGSTSGNYVPVYVYSDLNSGTGRYICVCRPRTRASSSVFGGGSITIPVGTGRKLYLIRSTNYNGTVSIDIRGYRRIGTNS